MASKERCRCGVGTGGCEGISTRNSVSGKDFISYKCLDVAKEKVIGESERERRGGVPKKEPEIESESNISKI